MLPSTDPTTIQPQNILFGIPKKGRLNEKVCKLLEGAGLEYRRVSMQLDGWGALGVYVRPCCKHPCLAKASSWVHQSGLTTSHHTHRRRPPAISAVIRVQPDRVDVAVCTGLPVTLVFLPAADIAAYVGASLPTPRFALPMNDGILP